MTEVRIDPLTGLRTLVGAAPVLTANAPEAAPEANRELFWAGPATGAHELIPLRDAPVSSLAELSAEELVAAAEGWRERMRAHADAAYVHLALEDGSGGEGSVRAELFALEFVPAALARERERFGAHATRTMGGNLLADLVQEEVRRRERIVAIDEESVLISPFGARLPYQLMIAPRRPRARYEDDGPTGARMLHGALARLRARLGQSAAVVAWVRTAPRGAEHFCWRIDIAPLGEGASGLGGLALGTGVHVNAVAPEQAAAELREA